MKHDMTMEETWKVTLEDPGIEVSNLGNVRRKDAKKRVNVAVSKHVKGYRTSRIAGKNLLLHRVVWGAFNGKIPDDKVIDHVNRDRSDNRLANLRLASSSENAHGGKAPNTVSDFRGVSFDAQSSKWSATITKDGKNIKIGLFGSEFEAAVAYDLYASDLYKGYAALNYPKLSSVFAKQTALAETFGRMMNEIVGVKVRLTDTLPSDTAFIEMGRNQAIEEITKKIPDLALRMAEEVERLLPKRKGVGGTYSSEYVMGFNACLEKITSITAPSEDEGE